MDFNYINFGSGNKEENYIELLSDLEDTEEDEIKIGSTVKEQSEIESTSISNVELVMKSKGKISYTLILDNCKKISERISAGSGEKKKNDWVKVFDELIDFFLYWRG